MGFCGLLLLHLVFDVWNSSGGYGKEIYVSGIDELWLDQWHTLAITRDVSDPNNDTVLLDNGSYAGSDLPTAPYTNDTAITVGTGYIGQVDKLSWFNALDSFSLAAYMTDGRTEYDGPFSPSPIAQFRCDEGTGLTITDNVSGTLTGTITNAAWVPDDRPKRR